MKTALKPETQVQVWAIQAFLADDKPRTFAEIKQSAGFDPEAALEAMYAEGKVAQVAVEGVIFWRRRARK